MSNVKSCSIVRALIQFFTRFGMPKEIQSDQGSNFTLGLFQQVTHELGTKQFVSSAYHPETNGCIERVHSTLKTMMRTYCFEKENQNNWDEGIPLLLFAVRDSVQESLGFSSFELVFGHRVHGPLSLLRECWSGADTKLSLLEYVAKFKDRLRRACTLAKENLEATQVQMKTWYDKKARARKFQTGDKVLVLFPLRTNPLQARFHGPYEILSKVNDLNYVVMTPDRRKASQLCHVNMLKAYHARGEEICVVAAVERQDENSEKEPYIAHETIVSPKLANSDILANLDDKLSHLEPWQQSQLKDLISQYRDLFPDVPRITTVTEHDVDVGQARPIKQHPYRLGLDKAKLLKGEIDYMLENNIIQASSLEWSTPTILIPKPGTDNYRVCTDYRKVNAVTRTDAYPITRIDDCVDRVGNCRYSTKMDLLKGYYAVKLTDRARQISAFVTPEGLFEYNVMAFGMKNAPSTFQRLVNEVTRGMSHTHSYIDDLITGNDTWEKHLEALKELFQRLSSARLTVNLAKSEFGQARVIYLGHIVGQGKLLLWMPKLRPSHNFRYRLENGPFDVSWDVLGSIESSVRISRKLRYP